MNILVNCSNLKAGGALQVADSFCRLLEKYSQHKFYIVLSPHMNFIKSNVKEASNIVVYTYEIRNSIYSVIMGRDDFLDGLVARNKIDIVLTIFGPSRWCPKVPHLSGFAMPQLIMYESPFFKKMRILERLKWCLWRIIRKWSFKKSANYYWTENTYISERIKEEFGGKPVFTISNYYHQVYDDHSKWKQLQLTQFDGITCITISSPLPHKNLKIIPDVIRNLRTFHPDVKVRFVLTINENEMPVPDDLRNYFCFIGKVDVSECPCLYEQSDIMFMPTLMECFTATYPEAMRMEVPIVTTDLEFAHGLCGDAACYYSAVDPKAAAEAIYKVATDKEFAAKLVTNGKEQLKKFDNYEQRADKLIKIFEEIVNETGSNT